MKTALLKHLCCVECRGDLTLNSISETEIELLPSEIDVITGRGEDLAEYTTEVDEGTLDCCSCTARYQISNGIPRLYKGAEIHRTLDENKDEGFVQRSFNREWDEFDYEDDRIWLWTKETRIDTFCEELAIDSAEQLRGKLMADCGCGPAVMSMNLSATYQIEVIAMDMTEVIDRAQHINTSNLCHFIQGSVLSPPLKSGITDLTYSHGVLHHTYSTEKAFAAVEALTKPGGTLFVWLYGKKEGWLAFRFLFHRNLRRIISRLPKYPQTAMVYVMAGIHLTVRFFKRLLGMEKVQYKTMNQFLVTMRDKYTPKHAREHREDEVKAWFKEHDYSDVNRQRDWPKTTFWQGSTDLAIRGTKNG